MIIKKSTTDTEIATKLSSEEILHKFAVAKKQANRWDAERDRLRKFIQEHMEPGKYGQFILDKALGTPRVYASSAGNAFLQVGLAIDTGLVPKQLKAGQEVAIYSVGGEKLVSGIVLDNSVLFSKKAPTQITLMEVPNES